jgi:hypothetical protein
LALSVLYGGAWDPSNPLAVMVARDLQAAGAVLGVEGGGAARRVTLVVGTDELASVVSNWNAIDAARRV